MKSRSITHQAALRLIFSLGLFVVLLGISSYKLYSIALHKSAHIRAENLATFYRTRLMQLDREWDLQARDFKVRLEVTRLLEDQKTSVTNLQAFMTVQGTNRRFQYMLIQNRKGDKVFDFGNELNLNKIPVPSGEESSWYLSNGDGNLYRVFVMPIWLGKAGNGRMAMFYKIDNALLFNLATPDIVLAARNDGISIASSAGQAGLERVKQPTTPKENVEEREIPWSTKDSENTFLRIDAPIKALFTATELTLSASTIPVIDGLILWFTLGFWLIRNARRIKNLGDAVEEFTAQHRPTAMLEEKLHLARGGHIDEISEVACAIEGMAEQIMQREREREVEEAQRRLWSMVFASGNEAILITDRDNHILTVNAAFTHFTGYTEDEIIGKNPRFLSAGREPREFYQAMWRQLEEYGNWSGEIVDKRKDGSIYPKWLNISVARDAAGNVANYVGTFFDITERKKNEERMIAINKELDDFAYIAAHDLKEPLRGIRNYASFLKEDYAGQLAEGAQQYINSIQRLAERLSSLIDSLLAYSRLGSTELAYDLVDVDAIIDAVAEDLSRLWTTEGIELRRNGHLGMVHGDAIRVGEVFQNLISNAAKYNDKPSKWIEVGCDHSSTPPVFYVRDNGIGIPPQHQEKVFSDIQTAA